MKGCNALLKSYLQSWKKSKWRQKKNFDIYGELTDCQKQIKLCSSPQEGELFKPLTFSFPSWMLKLAKKIKLWFAMFENAVKI